MAYNQRMHQIESVKPHQQSLILRYADGAEFVVDMAQVIAQGGVYAPLADPVFFAQVQVGRRGRFLAWPDELEFCADALRLQGQATISSAS